MNKITSSILILLVLSFGNALSQTVETFTDIGTSTFTVPNGVTEIEYLVVAGVELAVELAV